MDFSTRGYFFVGIGAVAIAIGVVLATGSRLFLSIGAIVIAIGGVSTTKGWNLVNVSWQRKNLIRSIAQEWLLNRVSLTRPPISQATDDKRPGIILYPTLRTSALKNALASGLFQFSHSKDGELLVTIVNYQASLVTANNEFNIINGVFNKSSPSDKVDEKYHNQVLQSYWFRDLMQQQELMRKLLKEHYRWSLTKQKTSQKTTKNNN